MPLPTFHFSSISGSVYLDDCTPIIAIQIKYLKDITNVLLKSKHVKHAAFYAEKKLLCCSAFPDKNKSKVNYTFRNSFVYIFS